VIYVNQDEQIEASILSNVKRNSSSDEVLLTAIVPISMMAGRLDRLRSWLSRLGNLPINIVLIHDVRDRETQLELEILINSFSNLNIELISGEFGSPGIARNAGLKTNLAKWVSFWDSDDLPNPSHYVEAILEAHATTEVIIGNFIVNSPAGITTNEHQSNLDMVALSPGIWRFVFRHDVIQDKFFTDTRMGEDQLFLLQANVSKRNIRFTQSIFYEYFQDSILQLTADQKAINEVNESFYLAKQILGNNSELNSTFAQKILTRLFLTTLFRCKRENKILFVLSNLVPIVVIHPKTFFQVLFELRRQSGRNAG